MTLRRILLAVATVFTVAALGASGCGEASERIAPRARDAAGTTRAQEQRSVRQPGGEPGLEGGAVRAGSLAVTSVVAAQPVTGERAALYLTVQSRRRDDALVRVAAEGAERAEIHRTVRDGGVMRMERVDSVPIPAGGTVRFEPGGLHIMLLGLRRPLQAGDTILVTFSFRVTGTVTVGAAVVPYAELDRALRWR